MRICSKNKAFIAQKLFPSFVMEFQGSSKLHFVHNSKHKLFKKYVKSDGTVDETASKTCIVASYREAAQLHMIPEKVSGLDTFLDFEITSEPRTMNKILFWVIWLIMVFASLCTACFRIFISSRCFSQTIDDELFALVEG